MTTRLSSTRGFTIVEFIIAVGIFVIFATAATSTILHSGKIDVKGNKQEKAARYSQEGLEAVRSIRNQSFSSLVAGTYGLSSTGGTWALSGSQNYNDGMMRKVTISNVYRNGTGTIVTSGGTLDPDTKKSTVTVTWEADNRKQQTVTTETYLTNFKKSLGCNSWGTPVQESSLAIGSAHEGWKVKIQGNYAYITFSAGGTDFAIVDISDTANPVVRSTLNLNSSNQNNVAVQGNYVYLASTSTAHEMKIINVSNPAAPVVASTYNLPGNADANGVYLVGNTLYITRSVSSDKEFYVMNVANPASPQLLGTYEVGATVSSVVVMGNYAYLATASDTQELLILNISNPAAITKVASYNIANNTADAISITGYNNRVYLGLQTGGMSVFDVTTAASPQLVGTYSSTGSINDMLFLSDPSCLFMATSQGFKVIDVSNPAAPSSVGGYSVSEELNGVAYDPTKNRVFLTTEINSGEFVTIKPQ